MPKTLTLDEVIVPITVEYLEEDRVYKVSVPALQGCHAWGETLDEAMQAIPGNIRAMLEARRAQGASIPRLFRHVTGQTPLVLRMAPV
ncbi:MAG: type II toxin-antitoxin system HicB family antitoxin [Anaerolineae bacterium]|nr:type II toxin-antitoxin system HicB family antitoxin [Anaerolineae bacterium]